MSTSSQFENRLAYGINKFASAGTFKSESVSGLDVDLRLAVEQAVVFHDQFMAKFGEAKVAALKCGYFFTILQRICEHGTFLDTLAIWEHRVSQSQVYRYIKLFKASLEWNSAEDLFEKSATDALEVCVNAALQSPREFTELYRAAGFARQFGQYDKVKYATRRDTEAGREKAARNFALKIGQSLRLVSWFQSAQRPKLDRVPVIASIVKSPDTLRTAADKLNEMAEYYRELAEEIDRFEHSDDMEVDTISNTQPEP